MSGPDPFDLERFVTAQASTYDDAVAELMAGRKRSHWMWFVFPQMRGLGVSATARTYGIGSLSEARAYLAHPLLGPRLVRIAKVVLALDGPPLAAIFGSPDDMKFRSSMTLFAHVAGASESAFQAALDRYCSGRPDERTLALIAEEEG